MRFLLFVLGVLLLGCDQAAEVVSNDLARVQAVPAEPNYVLVDGLKYGYESVDGRVIMLKFIGEKLGEYQFLESRGPSYSLVYRIRPPYEFYKQLEVSGSVVVGASTYRLAPDAILSFAAWDAKNGLLKRFVAEEDGVKYLLWLGGDNKVEWSPQP